MWDAVAPRMQALLAESRQWTSSKQRLTATRLHELLLAEGHHVGVTVIRDAVAEWNVDWLFVFASAAFNLIRLPKLLPRPA